MKYLVTVFLVLITFNSFCQTPNPKYDSALVAKLEADKNGMKMYVFVILKTGSNDSLPKAKSDSLFAGHLKNIGHLAKLGKLVLAGPFVKNDLKFRGIFILNVKTIDDATELLKTDPAIGANLLSYYMIRWYGSAAISEFLPFHEKLLKN